MFKSAYSRWRPVLEISTPENPFAFSNYYHKNGSEVYRHREQNSAFTLLIDVWVVFPHLFIHFISHRLHSVILSK